MLDRLRPLGEKLGIVRPRHSLSAAERRAVCLLGCYDVAWWIGRVEVATCGLIPLSFPDPPPVIRCAIEQGRLYQRRLQDQVYAWERALYTDAPYPLDLDLELEWPRRPDGSPINVVEARALPYYDEAVDLAWQLSSEPPDPDTRARLAAMVSHDYAHSQVAYHALPQLSPLAPRAVASCVEVLIGALERAGAGLALYDRAMLLGARAALVDRLTSHNTPPSRNPYPFASGPDPQWSRRAAWDVGVDAVDALDPDAQLCAEWLMAPRDALAAQLALVRPDGSLVGDRPILRLARDQ